MFDRDGDTVGRNGTGSYAEVPADVSELAERPPGVDLQEPYEDVRIDTLPNWWQEAIEEFDRHGMRTYQPPRFADDVPAYPLLVWLEHSLDADIQLIGTDNTYDRERIIRVNGTRVDRVKHKREPAGFTTYMISSSEFITVVSESVNG